MVAITALGLLLISGLALVGAILAGQRSQQGFARRLNLVTTVAATKAAPSAPPASRGSDDGKSLDLRLRGLFTFGLRREWGMKSGGVRLILSGLIASGAAGAIFILALHAPPYVSVPVAALTFLWVPRMLLKHEQAKAQRQIQDAFPDAIDMVIRMLRAGLPISSTVEAVGKEGPCPVDEVFREVGDQIKIGIPLNDALSAAGDRIGLADFRFFGVAVALQQATGGNLAVTLETLAEIMRKRRAMRLKGRATTGEARISAYILGGLPFLITGILLVIDPAYMAPLIRDHRGNVIAGLALLGLFLGFSSMRRMMRQLEK